MRRLSSSINYHRSLVSQNTFSRGLSFANNNQNYIINSHSPHNNMIEIEDILPLIDKDSNSKTGPPYNSVKVLSIYIRRNRNSIEDTINKISNFFKNNKELNVNLSLNIINSILSLLTEKRQIISYLNEILPILTKRLLQGNIKDFTLIENITNTIGNLIKIGDIYIRRLLSTDMNKLFMEINKFDPKNNKNENFIFASILYLCKIIENSSLFSFNKITEPTMFSNFNTIIDYFRDPKYEVRYAVGELIKQFFLLLKNRDYKTKKNYEQKIYDRVIKRYKDHLKENNDSPNEINIVLGLIEVLKKIYISEPFFLKNEKNYIDLVEELMKCKNSKINQIKIEFFYFLPELFQMNKGIFNEKYIKGFLEYSKKQLTLKSYNESKSVINALLISLGSLSLFINPDIFKICLKELEGLLSKLIKENKKYHKICDVEVFKCLADLLNNKDNYYMESVIRNIDLLSEIYFILSKIFKSGLTTYKIEFLISMMTGLNNFGMNHITTVIASLNAVSLILWDEEIKLEYFYKEMSDKNIKKNVIYQELNKILIKIKKHIRRYMNENNTNKIQEKMNYDYSLSENINFKCLNNWRIVIFALTLFSQIENILFLKDMLIFYNDKILPFLLFSPNKIKKKIIELILCKFVSIYPDDVNYSKYLLNNIINSIRNLIFSEKEVPLKIFAFNILQKKTLLLDIILENKEIFISNLIGILSTDEDPGIKIKLLETIGILASRSKDKKYFLSFTKKNVNKLLFTIDNCDDIIHKENIICLLLYYTLYLKIFYDLNIIEQIMEVLINLIINYGCQGIIFIDTLKIINELLDTDVINNSFLTNSNHTKINIFYHILLNICINNLKEGGDNTTKTEIILKVLYQIVKIQKITIYKDINNNNISNSLETLDINFNNKKYNKQLSKQSNNKKDNRIDKNNNNINENYNELLSKIKKNEKINLVDVLIQCIIKGLNDECLKIIMNIFGIVGSMNPSDISYHLDGNLTEEDYFDDKEFKLTKYNNKTKMNEEISFCDIEPSKYKPILYIIKFLKENTQQDLTCQIINSFDNLISNLERDDEKLVELILPTIIQVIPQVDIDYQKTLFSCIITIMNNFKDKINEHISDLVQLCKNNILIEQNTRKCSTILYFLFDNFVFEMEIYYPMLIPIFISILNYKTKKDKKDKIEILKIFILMAKNHNIGSYLDIILDDLTSLFLMSFEFDNFFIEFFNKISSLQNTYYFYPLIINTLIEKLNLFIRDNIISKEKVSRNKMLDVFFIHGSGAEENKNFVLKIIEIFKKMNQINREHFISFLPMIIKNLIGLGLIKYNFYEKYIQPLIIDFSNFFFIKKNQFEKIMKNQTCLINCVHGFNYIKNEINDNEIEYSSKNTSQILIQHMNLDVSLSKENSKDNSKDRQNDMDDNLINKKNSQFMEQLNKNKIKSNNNELILSTFNNTNCNNEKDWQEWFKSTIKVLFDQSPSLTLYYCRFIADYYFPLITELYNYAFFLAFINNNEKNQEKLIDYLNDALTNTGAPNETVLTILNLVEFIERKNIKIISEFNIYAVIANKCKAYAKALYYKENKFMKEKDFDDIEDLIELYHELKLPESAVGLMKLEDERKNKVVVKRRNTLQFSNRNISDYEQKDKEKEYIWYIKMHNYDEALKIITKQLEIEKKEKIINNLKKNEYICLNGLYDWEQILVKNDMNDNINNEINKNELINEHKNSQINNDEKQLKENIEKELLLSKACMNLGEWKKLTMHLSKINELFNNNDIEEQLLISKTEELLSINYINDDDNLDNNIIIDENDENVFCIKHGINNDIKMNPIEKEYINLNKYIFNYNKRALERLSLGDNKNSINNSNSGIFISYLELINNNPNLSFLENNEEILFDLNIYSTILNIQNSNYNLALNYISEAKKIILSRIKSLLSESYIRGYELLIKNQMLYDLEQIIDYKKNHFGDESYFNNMVNSWNNNLDIIGEEVYLYEKILAIRSLVLPINQDYSKYMDLVKICRTLKLYKKSENILLRLKNKLNINDEIGSSDNLRMNEIHLQIELSYNKCLFEKGKKIEAIKKSKQLIDLLDNTESDKINGNKILSKINDKIKSKIYGNYAIYKQKNFTFNKRLITNIEHSINNDSNITNIIHQSHKYSKSKSLIINEKEELNIDIKKYFRLNYSKRDESEMINQYFVLATKYNNSSYKLWHNYAMFNYQYYKLIYSYLKKNEIKNKSENLNKKEVLYAINAVNGFKHSLSIGGKNRNKIAQDLLRLIDIFFSIGDKSDNLLNLISESFNIIDIDAFLNVIPQLLCRFDLNNTKILVVLFNILTKIGLSHPNSIIFSLIVMKNSNSKKRKFAAQKVLSELIKKNYNLKKLIDEYEILITELNKCALLLHEKYKETVEDVLKLFKNKDYNAFANQMIKLNEKMQSKPDNMYEINFYQKYFSYLKEAEECILQYKNTGRNEYAKEAWETYHNIYKKIVHGYERFDVISLDFVSPKLYNFQESNIVLPGTYYSNYNENYRNIKNNNIKDNKDQNNKNSNSKNINTIIKIKKFGKYLYLFKTKQHPRKMVMIGTDNKEYMFLLKGHEDLRLDERVMQLFDLVNIILTNDKETYKKNLLINSYPVFPLSHNTGIIGWVPNCDTICNLLRDERDESGLYLYAEYKKVLNIYPKYESGNFLSKVETFEDGLLQTEGRELNTIIWKKSKNCETWLNRRTNYSRSLAVMSIVGYILGLGDRHPNNLMMSRKTGKIIHIDFGDCFEVAMKRKCFPEKVPFRLTRLLIKALEVSGIEGTFRLICVKVMELLRNNKDSLLAILSSFIHDPLISFRLMIPFKRKKINNINQENKIGEKDDINNNEEIINNDNNNLNVPAQSVSYHFGGSLMKLNQLFKNYLENNSQKENEIVKEKEKENKKEKENEKEKEKENKIEIEKEEEKIENEKEEEKIEEFVGKLESIQEEKKEMEDDEIEFEELNKIAQIVLDRIQDKLSGTDFYRNTIIDVKTQVDKLIMQATSYENLARSYSGWCPLW